MQPLFPYTGTLDLMPTCPVHPYPTLSFRYLFFAGLLALTVFIHVCLLFFSDNFYRLMILFLVASFSYCMAETRSCAAGTHSSQEHSPRLPDAPSTSGTPCSLNHSPRLPYHFHPSSSLAFGVVPRFGRTCLRVNRKSIWWLEGREYFLFLVHEKK